MARPPSPSIDELAKLRAEIEHAVVEERFEEATQLLFEDFISSWFTIPSVRMQEIITILARDPAASQSIMIRGLDALLNHPRGAEVFRMLSARAESTDPELRPQAVVMAQMFMARVQGRVSEAHELSAQMREGQVQPLFNPGRGWPVFMAVQAGITAMLAGDFEAALRSFTEVQLHPAVSRYSYLRRDALVKAALLHATFGWKEDARILLERSTEIERTSSWAERGIDACYVMADALVNSADPAAGLLAMQRLDLNDIGEVWPFHLIAQFRLLSAAGRLKELDQLLAMFEEIPVPRVDGEGLSGSVLPLLRAMTALYSSRLTEARDLVARTDASLAVGRLADASVQMAYGRARQAIDLAMSARDASGLRRLEIWRSSVIANGYMQLGDRQACLVALRHLEQLHPPITAEEGSLFWPEVQELAAASLVHWPEVTSGHTRVGRVIQTNHALSEREFEILKQLSLGHTRTEIAENLFVSVNTVKSQISSVYRKLEVTSAGEAFLEAERLGLLT